MPERRPLVILNGELQELPAGDTLPGASGGGGAIVAGSPLTHAAFTPPTDGLFVGEGSSVNGSVSYVPETERVKVHLGTPRTSFGVYFAHEPITAGADFTRIYVVSLHLSGETASFIGVSVKNSSNGRSINFGKFNTSSNMYYNYYLNNDFQSEAVHDTNEASFFQNDLVFFKVQRVGNNLTFGVSRDGILWAESVTPFDISTDNSLEDIDRVGFFLQETLMEANDIVTLEVVGRDIAQQPVARTATVNNVQKTVTDQATYSTISTDFLGTKNIKVNHSTGCTITVEPSMVQNDPCTFIQTGTGQLTFVQGTGVTIHSADGHTLTRTQFSAATLIPDKDIADTYYLIGDLTT